MNENGRSDAERGAAFFVVTILALVATVLIGAYFTGSLGKVRHVEQEISDSSAFNAAEAGLNAAIEAVWNVYRAQPVEERVAYLDRLDGKDAEEDRVVVTERDLGRSRFTAEVTEVRVEPGAYADVQIVARGGNGAATRTITAVVRYDHGPARVFDHGYFINNYGWLWGAGVTVNGSVRANGNLSLKNATVNGDLMASENPESGATGSIEGDSRHDPRGYYNGHYSDRARPTNPTAVPEDLNDNGILDEGEDTNGNGKLDTFELEDGYTGEQDWLAGLPHVEMPYLGDLSIYGDQAIESGGTLSQGGVVLVDGVRGDEAGEDSNLLVVGTEDAPIVIDGPVVIENDVVLRGYITGKGTIYAGRNVHIIGDLRYVNPPSWPKPVRDMESVRAANAAADIVGFAARGSIILGDYTVTSWSSTTQTYQRPPFTEPYVVDPADADIGYVSGYDGDGRPYFDGDYRAYDGGTREDDDGNPTPRRFFESSYSDALIHSLADEQVQQVDGVLYTNHLLSGKVGSCVFNGTLVSRDEAIIYNGSLLINYDIRVRSGGYAFLETWLPQEPRRRILYWSEGS